MPKMKNVAKNKIVLHDPYSNALCASGLYIALVIQIPAVTALGREGASAGSLGAPWSRYLTQSAPTDSAPSLEKPGLRRSGAASSVRNPHSVFACTKDHSVCGLEPASCMCLVT